MAVRRHCCVRALISVHIQTTVPKATDMAVGIETRVAMAATIFFDIRILIFMIYQ